MFKHIFENDLKYFEKELIMYIKDTEEKIERGEIKRPDTFLAEFIYLSGETS